ncbi:cell division protein FtsA C-terminal domain-containing protein [uncultured Streptococcus sp.]|uniref:cell division protein FtsA C-terminal domain-containing protein n=1 Tax=uncultured Streptococcus sp. TaxID=83427 RepID=UPI0035A8CE43
MEEALRHQPVAFDVPEPMVPTPTQTTTYVEPSPVATPAMEPIQPQTQPKPQEPAQPKVKVTDRLRGIFGSMFD